MSEYNKPGIDIESEIMDLIDKGLTLLKSDPEAALKCFKDAINKDPTHPSSLAHAGTSLLGLKRYEEALEYCEKSLKIDPKNEGAWCCKGIALQGLGKDKEALDAYNKALEIDPKLEEAWTGKGMVLDNLGRHDKNK